MGPKPVPTPADGAKQISTLNNLFAPISVSSAIDFDPQEDATMKKTLLILLGSSLLVVPAFGAAATDANQAPTFYADVLPVIQDNCQVCHREGGSNLGGMVAPMSFTTGLLLMLAMVVPVYAYRV